MPTDIVFSVWASSQKETPYPASVSTEGHSRLKPWLKPGATVIFHDTAPHCQGVIGAIVALLKEGAIHGVNFATPRGVFVGRVAYTTGA